MFFASTMVMVSVALVMAVIVTNIYAKQNSSDRCPEWAVRLACRFYHDHTLPERRAASGTTPTTERRSYSVGHDPEKGGGGKQQRKIFDVSSTLTPNGKLNPGRGRSFGGGSTSSGGGDLRAKRGSDDSYTAACGHDSSHRRRLQRASRVDDVIDGSGDVTTTTSPMSSFDEFNVQLAKAEWQLVAMFADRVFLWVFTALSCITHVTLFVQMLPHTPVR